MIRTRRLLTLSGLTAFVVFTGLTSGPHARLQDAGPPKTIPTAAARTRIETHDALIEKRYREMNLRYAYGPAERTLRTLFQESGIKDSLEYAPNWGNNGLWLAWEPAQIFYRYHRGALAESLNVVRGQSDVRETDLIYLDEGMKAWREHERRLELLFLKAVDVYLKRAVNADKKFALQDKYRKLRAEAFAAKAFDRIGSLITEEAETLKPITMEASQLEDLLDRTREEISALSRKRLFGAIKAGDAPPRRTSAPANSRTEEKTTPEAIIRSGRAPGANENDTP